MSVLQDLSSGSDEDEDSEAPATEEQDVDFQEYNARSRSFNAKTMEVLSRGWTAFVVGVALPQSP